MRKLQLHFIAISFFALFGFVSSVEAKSITCNFEYSGVGKTEVRFNSSSLSLVWEISLLDRNGHPDGEPSTKILLSNDQVCGAKIDVLKLCQMNEQDSPKFGYSFSMKCNSNISLEFYVDENGEGHAVCRQLNKQDDHYETSNCK